MTAPIDPRSRLIPTGPTTAVEADWSKPLCVFCTSPLAKGEPTKCTWHKAISASTKTR